MFTIMLLMAFKEAMSSDGEKTKSEAVEVPDFNKILKNLN